MSQPNRYQYVELVGPVLVPTAAPYDPAGLEWQPRWQQPARGLRPNKPSEYVSPIFEPIYDPEGLQWLPYIRQPARTKLPHLLGDYWGPERIFDVLYKPQGLEWQPSDRYSGKPRPYSLTRWYVIDPIPPVNPVHLSWLPRDSYFGRRLPSGEMDYSVYPPFEPLYDPEGLEWLPSGQHPIRGLDPRRLTPFSLDPFPPTEGFDPQTLEWLPRGQQPARGLPQHRLGEFAPVIFEALYKPEGLQWVPSGRQPRLRIELRFLIPSIIDPTVLIPVPFDPAFFPHETMALILRRVLAQPTRQGMVVVDPTTPTPPTIVEFRKLIDLIAVRRMTDTKG